MGSKEGACCDERRVDQVLHRYAVHLKPIFRYRLTNWNLSKNLKKNATWEESTTADVPVSWKWSQAQVLFFFFKY